MAIARYMARLVVVAMICAPAARAQTVAPTQCQMRFEGGRFLAEAQSRGITLSSDCTYCARADLGANEFHALPSRACTCRFLSDKWLSKGWKFVAMTGEGTWSLQKQDASLVVRIAAGCGLKILEVIVEAEVDDCARKTLTDVLM